MTTTDNSTQRPKCMMNLRVAVPRDMGEAVQVAAKREDRSASYWIRLAIKERLERQQAMEKPIDGGGA